MLIGEGSQGRVNLAQHKYSHALYAIKILAKHHPDNLSENECSINERLQKLQNANFVKVYEILEDD